MEFPIPRLLKTLIESGEWRHPGDDVLIRVIPLMTDPVDFREWLPFQTVTEEIESLFAPQDWQTFKMHLNNQPAIGFPWLNADRAVHIAINRIPGDDVAIALDYRGNLTDPVVVASYWRDNKSLEWFEVAKNFREFATSLGLIAG